MQSEPTTSSAGVEAVRDLATALTERIGRVVVGQEAIVEGLLVTLLSQGHVLIEGVPGTAKTLLARAFARCLRLDFGRIQFTPDLMPGDVIGTNLFDFQTNRFTLTRGPVFTDFLLADEINRTPPKTQSALLQAMQERAVTVDRHTHPLSEGFMVVATQNPLELEGTYPLPEAQLDRFLLKLRVAYPTRDEEREVVRRHGNRTAMPDLDAFGLEPVADLDTLRAARAAVAGLTLAEELIDYIVDLVRATRQNPSIQFGASPRSASMVATASRALAALRGRTYVLPDDVKELFLPAMRHRVILGPSAEVEGATTDQVLTGILDAIPTPR